MAMVQSLTPVLVLEVEGNADDAAENEFKTPNLPPKPDGPTGSSAPASTPVVHEATKESSSLLNPTVISSRKGRDVLRTKSDLRGLGDPAKGLLTWPPDAVPPTEAEVGGPFLTCKLSMPRRCFAGNFIQFYARLDDPNAECVYLHTLSEPV